MTACSSVWLECWFWEPEVVGSNPTTLIGQAKIDGYDGYRFQGVVRPKRTMTLGV